MLDSASETAEQNSTKLDSEQELNALYQVCVFRANQKTKMAAPASDWLRHFQHLFWNHWMEFEETWQVCVFWVDQKTKMATLASDWLRHFLVLLWNRWTEFYETWQEARTQRTFSIYEVCVFLADRKTKMAALASD